MADYTYWGTLVAVRCYKCGVPFGLDSDYEQRRRNDRDTFYCPAGHGQHFTGVSEAQRLRDELAREKHRTEQAQAEAVRQSQRVAMKERQLRARKGQVTKMRNRIEKGVCPCCDRYFENLHRHMEGQHPEWKPDAIPDEKIAVDGVRRGRDLRALREAAGLSRAALAKKLGIKTSTLHCYESPNAHPPHRAFDALEPSETP